jgi:hypothetical protein
VPTPVSSTNLSTKAPASSFIKFIRVLLLVLIVVGLILIATQSLWVPKVVEMIIGPQPQYVAPAATSIHATNAAVASKTYKSNNGMLDLVEKNGTYMIHLIAAGTPNGAATAADCEIYATGTKTGDTIIANFIPFDGDLMSYSAKEAAAQKRTITMTITDTAVNVLSADSTGYCADGVNPDGAYLPSPVATRYISK